MEYYTSEKNIGNQELVNETIGYFSTGPGQGAFKPIDFLNLLNKQYFFLVDNVKAPETVIAQLEALPLSDEKKHILFGFLLKWFGGYPIEYDNEDYDFLLKKVQSLFLAYPGETPEKDFCKADMKRSAFLQKLSIAFTTAINNNINLVDVLEDMGPMKEEKKFYSFDKFFEAYRRANEISLPEDPKALLIEITRYSYQFTVWLQANKGLEYGNEEQYGELLTFENFDCFLKDEARKREIAAYLNSLSPGSYEVFTKQYNALRNSFRVKSFATKEDCEIIPGLKVGDVIEYDPPFTTSLEGYTLLTQYYAKCYFEFEKFRFTDLYKVWNEETVKAEITEIEKFIRSAEELSLTDACRKFGTGDDNQFFVYKRLKSGFYLNLERGKYPSIGSIGNLESVVYGRYFHFYDYLNQYLAAPGQSVQDIAPVSSINDSDKIIRIKEVVEERLSLFRTAMSESSYSALVSSLSNYFNYGSFTDFTETIQVNGKINKKQFGWGLNQIFRSLKDGPLTKEYLAFAKNHISIFKGVSFEESSITGSNLYKYFTTKTK